MELYRGEQIIYRGRPAARAGTGYFVRWGAIALAPGVLAGVAWWYGVPTVVPVAAWWALTILGLALVVAVNMARRRARRYTLTTDRVIVARGLIARTERTLALERVQNVTVRQSPRQRLLGIGDVEFDSGWVDPAEAQLRFAGIARPRQVARRIGAGTRDAGRDLWEARF